MRGDIMQSESDIKIRLVEVKGEIRNFDNHEALDLPFTSEMYDVVYDLAAERDTLEWVLTGPADCRGLLDTQVILTFPDKKTFDYIMLVARRKSYDLTEYLIGNFEWDDRLPCIEKIDPEDCEYCDFRDGCPDVVLL